MPKEITDATFETDVLQSDKPVLVDFWAPWCGPCHMLTPIMEELDKELGGSAVIYKLNVDENPETASKYGISAIPTVLVFKNGELANQMVGVQQKQNYKTALVG